MRPAACLAHRRQQIDRRSQDERRRVHARHRLPQDRKSTRLNSSHSQISYAVFCLKKKKTDIYNASILRSLDSAANHTPSFRKYLCARLIHSPTNFVDSSPELTSYQRLSSCDYVLI